MAVSIGQKEDREFAFTDVDFERVRKLIYDHAGIALAPIKRDMVYSRLVRRLRALNLRSFELYLNLLEKRDAKEWEVFVNSLTTNLTYFFREAHHFDVLAQHMKTSGHRPYRIWCSAASTGEEPYSLAMTACEAFNTLTPPVSIIASDIDTNVLNTAREGLYGLDRTEKLSPARLQKFFVKATGGKEGLSRVRPELQALISYQRVNLLDVRYAGITQEHLDHRFISHPVVATYAFKGLPSSTYGASCMRPAALPLPTSVTLPSRRIASSVCLFITIMLMRRFVGL